MNLKKQFKKEEKKFLQSEKQATIELYLVDAIVVCFLVASTHQLVVSFGGDGWAWFKAIAFEALIAVLIRNITRASVYKMSLVGSWFALVGAMAVSFYANLNYEWIQYSGEPFVTWTSLVNFDTLHHIRACVFSGTLPFMIIATTIGRETIAQSLQSMREKFYQDVIGRQKDLERKEKNRERQRKHRGKKSKN